MHFDILGLTLPYLRVFLSEGSRQAVGLVFLSARWGRRVSDELIKSNSGFLEMLSRGHCVLADSGFLLDEKLPPVDALLILLAFSKRNRQLTARELRVTSSIPHVASSNPGVTSSNPRVTSSNPRVTSSNSRVTISNSRVTSSNPRVTSSNSRVTSSNPRVSRPKSQVARLKDYNELVD